jgi:hypothetical protein
MRTIHDLSDAERSVLADLVEVPGLDFRMTLFGSRARGFSVFENSEEGIVV